MVDFKFRIPKSLTVKDIMTQAISDPDENPFINGEPVKETIKIESYNPDWPLLFNHLKAQIQAKLGELALTIEHIGSTAVPGLSAKPVIDIDLIVADATQEEQYLPLLEPLGYWLQIREPSWYQHRCLRMENPRVNLHVFSPETPEAIRHVLFRDWLRLHKEEQDCYAAIKLEASNEPVNDPEYNKRKNAVVHAIYSRLFDKIEWSK